SLRQNLSTMCLHMLSKFCLKSAQKLLILSNKANFERGLLILFLALAPSLMANFEEENALIVCENGLEMFYWDLDFISQAEQTLEISGCLCGGQIFLDLLAAIDVRMQECSELQVYILSSSILLEDADRATIHKMEKKYPQNFHFQLSANVVNLLPDCGHIENHVKCVIVDETYFSAGGTNLEEMLCTEGTYTPERDRKKMVGGEMFPLGSRDMDLVGRGPIVKELRTLFYKLYAMWEDYAQKSYHKFISDPEEFKDKTHYKPVDGMRRPFVERFETSEDLVNTSHVKLLYSGPMHSPNKISQEYERLINLAKSEITIANLYFNPTQNVLDACMSAANRKVDLTVISNGINDLSPSFNAVFCWANRINYVPIFYGRNYFLWEFRACIDAPLKKSKIYEYHVKDIVYHKKVMVIDRHYTLIGSYNLGLKSDEKDYEIVLVIDSPEIAEQTLKVLERDRSLSLPVNPKDAREWYFNPLTAYLGRTQKQFHSFI
ncbi:MAG: hypothetical protein KR126chlam2_01183, partial [Chlamydiae bacterium]|nr:hypothetical protein [Chlamydiota bacterium]